MIEIPQEELGGLMFRDFFFQLLSNHNFRQCSCCYRLTHTDFSSSTGKSGLHHSNNMTHMASENIRLDSPRWLNEWLSLDKFSSSSASAVPQISGPSAQSIGQSSPPGHAPMQTWVGELPGWACIKAGHAGQR